jgi:hypothetical protein
MRNHAVDNSWVEQELVIEGKEASLEPKEVERASIKSYVDSNLWITEDLYAVSYVKKNYASGTDLPEHAFIIIQTLKDIRRAEVLKKRTDEQFLVYAGNEAFTEAGYMEVCKKMV